MNQPQMAQALDVSVATVSRICSGSRRPSTDLMATIRRVTGWSVERQMDALQAGNYSAQFTRRMKRQSVGRRVARA